MHIGTMEQFSEFVSGLKVSQPNLTSEKVICINSKLCYNGGNG